jgi:serine/threonine-protein kinase HipA
MGALVYEPELGPDRSTPTALDMRALVEEARLALNADLSRLSGADALRSIIRVGTSAGGAQAKAIVAWNREKDAFNAGQENLPDGFGHWIIKFTPKEIPWFGEREYAVCEVAKACGIEMGECLLYELDGLRHFMVRRFDRIGDRRHLVQTYCALRHLPPGRTPVALCTYEGLFDTIAELDMGYGALEQMFRRMAFNVLAGERDDHTKNFSFIMKEGGRWNMAPAYDLTGRDGFDSREAFGEWSNRHALSVNGKFSSIGDQDMLLVGERYGIGNAKAILEEIKDRLSGFKPV